MKITTDLVQKVAVLARIGLSESEAQKLTSQLSAIVGYFEQLDELDLGGIEATSHAVPLDCPQRADEVCPSEQQDALLSRAPHQEHQHFVVPRVIES